MDYIEAQRIWCKINHILRGSKITPIRMPIKRESGWGGRTNNPDYKITFINSEMIIKDVETDTIVLTSRSNNVHLEFPFFCLKVVSVQGNAK